ncbi:hypothetical protein [Actinocorallia longicatena]|uniref:Uncharacterized protein n=1 Tax=Actinocorallia longicatena TaxID=111803 RepID=A0ABP6QFK7_9ACTN
MDIKVGMRLFAQNSTCEVVVIRAAENTGTISCAGADMLAETPGTTPPPPDGPSVELGKRYAREDGTVELLCTKAGTGPLAADGQVLQMKTAKPLPASD